MTWVIPAAAIGLLMMLGGGGGSRRRSSSSSSSSSPASSPSSSSSSGRSRGTMTMGPIRTTADLQSERLGIGRELWTELVRMAGSLNFRRRDEYRPLDHSGPVARIEAWLNNVRGWRAEGSVETLEREARWCESNGYPSAAAYARLLASSSPAARGFDDPGVIAGAGADAGGADAVGADEAPAEDPGVVVERQEHQIAGTEVEPGVFVQD